VEHETVDEGVVISIDVKETELEKGSTVTLTVSAGVSGIAVPDLLNNTAEEAERKLRSLGLQMNKTEVYHDTVEAGRVISQSPVNGNKVPNNSAISVTVSKGKEEVKIRVPNLVGYSEQDGTIMAIEAGLEIGSVAKEYSSEVEEGNICYQSYSHGSYVDPGTSIDIKISMGPEDITYKYNASFAAPSVEEAPGYLTGSEVEIKLVADDGKVLLETKTSSFPKAANFYVLTSSGGTLTMTYTVHGTGETKSFTRRIEFVRE